MLPSILSYLYGVPEIQWKEEFRKYVVEQKVMSLASMDWTDVLQKWPYQNRFNLTKVLDVALTYCKNHMTSNCPLYQQVSTYLSRPIKKASATWVEDRRRDIRKIFDEIRFGKQ